MPLAEPGFRGFVRARMHRRLFFTMGLAILGTFGAAFLVLYTLHPESPKGPHLERLRDFFSSEFADSWTDPARRDAFAERARLGFGVHLELHDAKGSEIGVFGGRCDESEFTLPVQRDGKLLGEVWVCSAHPPQRKTFVLAFVAAGVVLWLISGFAARRIGRPLWELVQVTRELGEGRLSSRARLGRHLAGEVGVLANSINEMASRIERQLSDQKELLASVSHEIRTPLTRLRLLTEFLRDSGANEKFVRDAELEIAEIDDLTGRLLATSRLEFEALETREFDAAELCRNVLTRLGLDAALLEVRATDTRLVGDATLLGRALLNLLLNAANHAGGATRLLIETRGERLAFVVDDAGPGFDPAELTRVFDSFYRGRGSGGSLGLGLSLVRRIARAHGGDSFAENRAEGGARVGLTLRVRPAAPV
ncbi:MAG TPA: HAMP domain-containing sensor histidine kinase [Polyangiaceae bacterium]|nr:HAMP domain-containing sensor histidine kinase [Polyangiaceae bacterium]